MGNSNQRTDIDDENKDPDDIKDHPTRRDDDADHAGRALAKLFADQTDDKTKMGALKPDDKAARGDQKPAIDGDKAAIKPDDKAAKPDDKAAKPEDKAAKPDDKAAKPDEKKEVIELAKLPVEKQQEVERLRELQGFIIRFADKLKFGSDDEKKQFMEKLQKELGEGVEGEAGKFKKLPEFGEASKEGFKKLKEFLEKGAVPDLVSALDKQLLAFPPGFPLKIAGKQEEILKSSEQLRQELAQGKGFLDIDTNKLEDVRKLGRVSDWMNAADKSLHDEHIVRLEKYLSAKVEEGIKKGTYPEGWRRPQGMDAETWCSAVEQTMNAYTRTTRVIEAMNYLQNSGTGFKSEALDEKNLPAGIKITRDDSGKITNVDFGNLMVPDLALHSDANRQKLDPLNAWCDKYEGEAQKGLREAFKDRNQVPGFGEAEVSGGYVNPQTKEFVMGVDKAPGSDWKPFNLLSYDMDIKEERDAFGQVKKVFVSSDVGFQQVPWFGYLNTCGTDAHREKSQKPVEYKPDDYVAVQTGPGQIEMIQAKNLSDWKARQELKYYGEKAIIATMDGAMVVSGLGELRAAAKVAQLGAKEAVAIGGRVLKTEVAGELPKGLAASMVRKGLFEIGLGATGIFHNAGAKEIPWMKAVSDLRTAYFLGHAGYSVLSLARVPQGARALGELASPGTVARLDSAITSIRGTEAAIRNGQLARTGALETMPFWKGLEKGTHIAFNVSEKAFVGMFLWDAVGMSQRFADPYRPRALEGARKALNDASLADRSALEKIIEMGNKPSERTENYFRRYMDTLGVKDQPKKDCEDIIARMKELSKPGAKEEDKQKYMQELMKYFRYDGAKIHDLQDGRLHENLLSEDKLRQKAEGDKDNFDPNVRKMAAMAILALSRKADGSWPENVADRTITVPKFTELIQGGDTVIRNEVGPKQIEQKLSSQELVNFLQQDMRATTDGKARTEKAAALHENGLVSGEQLGDLLLSRIEGKQEGVSKEDRLRAIGDLAGLVSRLKVEEQMRDGLFNRNEKYAARGLTAGLSSEDLLKRLEKAATESEDKDIKATAGLSLALLRKENLDDTDKQRIKDIFLKEPPGISEADFKKMLEADASAAPTDKSGWERKLIAAEILMRQSMLPESDKIDMKAVGYLRECLKAGNQPEIAVKALEALTKADRLGGSPLQTLIEKEPEKNWRNQIVLEAMNLFNPPAANLDANQQLEAAKARLKLIETITPLVKESEGTVLKRQLIANLLGRGDKASEPVEEVRAAAVKAIGEIGIREKDQIDLLKKAVDAKTEPSAAVRLAAIDAIERLVARNKERKEILAPLAVPEPDPAVKERLARYYEATGSIKDRNSQRSRQDVADARTEQNKEEFKPDDVAKMVKDRFKALAGSKSVFDYINADREPHDTLGFLQDVHQTIGRVWDSSLYTINESWDPGYVKDIARDNLFKFELIAQNRAVAAFNKGIDGLSDKAMRGSTDKTVPVGDKQVSERDAAILALGDLVRRGSRMGEAFYKHRTTDDRHEHEPGLRSYSEREQRIRNEYARDHGKGEEAYRSDPWPESERRVAEKMRDLCSKSADTVNLSLLKDQILLGLASDAKTRDDSRKILIDGLDKLLSNPQTSPEAKRDIIKKVADLVRNSKEVDKDKSESMVALIGLLDKHGKAVYEKDSEAYSVIRNNIEARGQMESFRSPPQVRLRAQEMFDREWQSVLSEYDKIPAQQGTARARAEILPKNYEALEKNKDGKADGHDEEVQDAVQRIIMATKGLPVTDEDPRRQTLLDLTDGKYDDRVRMAAMLALSESKNKDDASSALYKLRDLALNSSDRAIRQDAAKMVLRGAGSNMGISEGEVEGLRAKTLDKLAAALGKTLEDLQGKPNPEMVKDAADFVAKNLKSTDAPVAAKARELQEALHRYGEGLALIANLKLADKSDKSNREYAENMFKMSLSAFGVTDADMDTLRGSAKRNYHNPCSQDRDVRAVADKLIEQIQSSGNVPGLLSALNGYGKLCSAKIEDRAEITNNLDRGVGLVSLTEAIANTYYPPGSQGRVDEYKAIAEFFQRIGQSPITMKDKWYSNALQYMDKAKTELDTYRKSADVQMKGTKEGLNQTIDKQQAALQNDHFQANLELFNYLSNRPEAKTSNYMKGRLQEQSQQLEKELAEMKDKNSTTFQAQRFVKDWLDIRLAPDDKKAEARSKAEASLDTALKAYSGEFGPSSPQYEMMLKKMWSYHVSQGQPEKAEAFFKDGLEKTKAPEQTPVQVMLLKHYWNFLKGQKRDADAEKVATEYKRLTEN